MSTKDGVSELIDNKKMKKFYRNIMNLSTGSKNMTLLFSWDTNTVPKVLKNVPLSLSLLFSGPESTQEMIDAKQERVVLSKFFELMGKFKKHGVPIYSNR